MWNVSVIKKNYLIQNKLVFELNLCNWSHWSQYLSCYSVHTAVFSFCHLWRAAKRCIFPFTWTWLRPWPGLVCDWCWCVANLYLHKMRPLVYRLQVLPFVKQSWPLREPELNDSIFYLQYTVMLPSLSGPTGGTFTGTQRNTNSLLQLPT